MSGAERIAAERRRQIEAEGWTLEHDDHHDRVELATAGVGYAMFAVEQLLVRADPDEDDDLPDEAYDVPPRETEWPWHPDWWKPDRDPGRNLVKAGALIAAEIDRLERQDRAALDQETRDAGFHGYEGCPEGDCPTPHLCSERGDCRLPSPGSRETGK